MSRMSFSEFSSELLLAIAIQAKADLMDIVPLDLASNMIEGRFPQSWLYPAAGELMKEEKLAMLTSGGSVQLSAPGLRAAEQAAFDRGFDLYEHLDELEAERTDAIDPEISTRVITQGPISISSEGNPTGSPDGSALIIEIDHSSDIIRELELALSEGIKGIQTDNELIGDGSTEVGQHLAELKAGKELLKADQADSGLLRRLLLPALNWFLKKARDEVTSELIKKLITMITAFLT